MSVSPTTKCVCFSKDSMADEFMQMRPIGYLQSVFQFKNGTPRQPSLCSTARGSLTVDKDVFNNPEHSLEGLQQFSHAWIIFVFHKNRPGHTKAKVKPPRLNGKRMGVFSTRSPYRPNAIGLTLARIEKITGATVHFTGIDIIDGTPVLDIKPFIPQYDAPASRGEPLSAGIQHHETDTADPDVTEMQGVLPSLQGRPVDPEGDASDRKLTEHTGSNSQETECCSARVTADGCAEDTSTCVQDATQCLLAHSSFSNLNFQAGEEVVGACKPSCDEKHTDSSSQSANNQCGQQFTHTKHKGYTDIQGCKQKINTHQDSKQRGCINMGDDSTGSVEWSAVCSSEGKQTWEARQSLTQHSDASSSQATVAEWLGAPPVSKLCVTFTPAAEAQLEKFTSTSSGDSRYTLQLLSGVDEVRAAIVSVLAEDPRSVYRREKCSDSLYFFTVDQVHVTCWFDDRQNRVEVVRLQPLSFVEKLTREVS